jgi:hypothetical protein
LREICFELIEVCAVTRRVEELELDDRAGRDLAGAKRGRPLVSDV